MWSHVFLEHSVEVYAYDSKGWSRPNIHSSSERDKNKISNIDNGEQ